eukprot:gene27663-36412_t
MKQDTLPPPSFATQGALSFLTSPSTSCCLKNLSSISFHRIENMIPCSPLATIFNLGKAEEAGGLAYLNSLAQYVPSAANIRRYAEIVRERSILRKLIAASDEIVILTDGEEAGLLGAELFFAEHPLRKRIGLLINLESRGGGG